MAPARGWRVPDCGRLRRRDPPRNATTNKACIENFHRPLHDHDMRPSANLDVVRATPTTAACCQAVPSLRPRSAPQHVAFANAPAVSRLLTRVSWPIECPRASPVRRSVPVIRNAAASCSTTSSVTSRRVGFCRRSSCPDVLHSCYAGRRLDGIARRAVRCASRELECIEVSSEFGYRIVWLRVALPLEVGRFDEWVKILRSRIIESRLVAPYQKMTRAYSTT